MSALESACSVLSSNSCNNNVVGSLNLISGEVEYDSYGYNVWTWNAAIFVAVFGLMSILHLGLGIYSRHWWTLYTFFLGAFGELIGWSGRLWSAESTKWDPTLGGYWTSNDNAFLMQISVLIFSPAFLAAGNYILLGRIIPILGAKYTFIHPLSYTIIFVLGDLVSLIVQAIGGGQASAADTEQQANNGAYVMVGGVMFQMVVMVAYTIVLLLFVYRWRRQQPFARQIELFTWWPNALRTKKYKKSRTLRENSMSTTVSASSEIEKGGRVSSGFGTFLGEPTLKDIKGAKISLVACLLSTLFIFIRSIYRSVELLDGWHGKIITNQSLFNFLDGMLIAWSVVTFILVHPAFFMPRKDIGLS